MGVACRASTAPTERLWLTVDATPRHGSTALFLLLDQGSASTTTICSAGSWQCESWIKMLHANLSSGSLVQSWRSQLDAHAAFWDLRKPVWLTKWAPFDVPTPPPSFSRPAGFNAIIMRDRIDSAEVLAIVRRLPTELPERVRREGISCVRSAVVMMHRPWCLWPLSSSATTARRKSISDWATGELSKLEGLAARYSHHRRVQRPLIMLNYADLLWRFDAVTHRLVKFAPCLGRLSMHTNNSVRVGDSNRIAMHTGSFFIQSRPDPASCCGYNVSSSSCMDTRGDMYIGLSRAQRRRAAELEALLMSPGNTYHQLPDVANVCNA